LASLGNDETLRGYELNRFRGLNSMHLNVEYRFKLMQGFTNEGFKGVEAVMFSDIGQVYNNLRELSGSSIRATWGGGFQFVTDKSVGSAVLYAKSPETGRLIFRFGKTF
jgi:hemolysin activation/secretion protein